jgi:glycosyltransferase involved in cell wall biosynthesis
VSTPNGSAPRVSIVVPVYNAGGFLTRALQSAATQSYRDVETVVVDDGSTDARTLAILDTAERSGNAVVHRTVNRGVAAARNLAVERARGAFILPLDADDRLRPRFLEKTVPVLESDPETGIVHTWVELIGGHHGLWCTGEFSVRALLSRCTIHVTSLYRREVWADVGGYDPAFTEGAEDWDFWLSAAARGWRARCVPEPLAQYRRRPGSRELGARAAGVSARVMRQLIAKHRSTYAAHFDDALADLYEHHSAVCLSLERVYDHPAVRLALKLRGVWQKTPAP